MTLIPKVGDRIRFRTHPDASPIMANVLESGKVGVVVTLSPRNKQFVPNEQIEKVLPR